MGELRLASVSEVSRTSDRQPAPVQDTGVDHRARDIRVAILSIFWPAAQGLSAKVRSQVLCGVLLQAKSLGSLDETLGPLDAPLGRLAAEAPGSQGPSVAAPKGACSILVRLSFLGRLPPDLVEQKIWWRL